MRHRTSSNRYLCAGVAVGILLVSALCLVPASSLRAGTGASPANSSELGKSLAQWMEIYTSWFLGSTNITPDANGNSDVGRVVLLPIPPTPGDGTPGSIDVTLSAGQSFTLPFFQWIGNSYVGGSVDPKADLNDFKNMEITVKLDGVTLITNKNVMDYYTEVAFNPPLTTDLPPGATAWVFAQSVGMIHAPLTPGKHVFTLDESVSLADLNIAAVIFHNTWNITVKPGQ